ncbi:MAG: esterase-like activity of phytase family protein [Candidatus Glassbacteria bacterium]|nr:esterase-like activity of phytase family protein [Candidatus Glassbacteria bacterium]
MRKTCIMMLSLLCLPAAPAPAGPQEHPAASFKLSLWRAVFLQGTEAGNASGLAMGGDGYLYLVDDRGPTPPDWRMDLPVLYRLPADSLVSLSSRVPPLEAVGFAQDTRAFASLAAKAHKRHKFDLEGLAPVGENRFWAVDERDGLLLELDIGKGTIDLVAPAETLFQGQDDLGAGGINRSFEGITVIDSQLFLAHEMMPALVVRYHLSEQGPRPAGRILIEGSLDLTDADNDGGMLYFLGRMNSTVFKVDPESGSLVARADFSEIADSSAFRYSNPMDFFRNSEGLAVKGDFIYVVLDGNGQATLADPEQKAPLLLIFNRPRGF